MKSFFHFLIFLVLVPILGVEAQNVSISDVKNAPTDPTAVLDIYSDSKGVLVPRVALQGPDNPITGVKPNGLLVYNTVANATYKVEGFYFWKGTDWMPLGQDIYEIDTRAHYISTATSASNADYLLDQVCVGLQTKLDEISSTAGTPAQIQESINATRRGAGLDIANGKYIVKTDANFISSATSIHDATIRLDNTLKAIDSRSASNSMAVGRNSDNIDKINTKLATIGGGSTGTQAELDRTQNSLGLDADGSFRPITSSNYVGTATRMQDEIYLLDKALFNTNTKVAANTTTLTTINNDNTAINVKIGEHDVALNELKTRVDNTTKGAGLSADGTYTRHTSTNYINAATSLKDADEVLDQKIAENETKITNIITKNNNLQTELDATQAGSGLQDDGTYAPIARATYINTASSLQNESYILDQKVKEVKLQIGDHTNRIDALQNRATALETTVGQHETKITDLETKTNTLETEQNKIKAKTDNIITGAGLNADGSYSADATSNYTNTATSLADADKKLDAAIKNLDDSYTTKFGREGVVEAKKAIVADANKDVKGYNKIVVGSDAEETPSAAMEVNSTNRGFLFPRMTSDQILAIAAPAEGLVVYNLTQHLPVYYNGSRWMTYTGRFMDLKVGDRIWGGLVFSVNEVTREVLIVSEEADGSGTYAQSAINASNRFNGYNDWRLPTGAEMQDLYANLKTSGMAFNPEYWVESAPGAINADYFDKGTETVISKNAGALSFFKKVRKQKY